MLRNTDVKWLMDLSYCQWLRFHTVSTYPAFVDACVSSAIAIRTGDIE